MSPDIERVALLGWHLYPCSSTSKAACFEGATDAATCDLDTLERWSRQFPKANYRVVFGPSNLWALDCDVPPGHAHDGIANLAALVAKHGAIPPRPQARSGGGGLGLFFRNNGERIRGDAGHPAPGIDPRRGRQSQTIPPSIHIRTGQPYYWVTPPWEVNPPTAPDWLLNLLKPPPEPEYRHPIANTTDTARRTLYRQATAIMNAGAGGRNEALNRKSYIIGRMIGAGLLGEQEAVETLYGAARSIGLSHLEISATLKSSLRSGMRQPLERTA